jgi:hypothetical protein
MTSKGQPDVVVQRDPVGWVAGRIGTRGPLAARHELDLAGVVRPLAASPGRADLIQAQAAGHHDQPAAGIVDLTRAGAQQAGKCVLHHVLGRADVAQHPEGQVDQVGVVGMPRLDDLVLPFFGHVAHLVIFRPATDGASPGRTAHGSQM